MKRFKKVVFSLTIIFLLQSCGDDNEYVDVTEGNFPDLTERLYAGGKTTIFSNTSNGYSTPAPNLSGSELSRHLKGDIDFESIFVTAPANINSGLGPIFNNSSCISCHPRDGRAAHPQNIKARSGLLLRTSLPGNGSNGNSIAVNGFGLQIQNQAIFNFQPEAEYTVQYEEIAEKLADGTIVYLRKPIFNVTNTYIPFPDNALLSPRIAPPVFGLGLLELISDTDLINSQDINDSNGDGISGKLNYVWNPLTQQTEIGKFGWKANTPNLLIQCATAYVEDMGITNSVFPFETGHDQSNGNDHLNDDTELSDEILHNAVFYTRTLAVPAPRNIADLDVRKGAKLFADLQCATCHTPKQQTGFSEISALSFQTFYPYTDQLLHDMGEGLADNRPDFLANGREWKTRPLWGIGLTFVVNNHTHFLHDGRARNITEAILWHGGEAENAKQNFKKLSKEDREALLKFINSL